MEIHSPDIVGPVALATDPGVAGQLLTSAGPGVQAVWSTPAGSVTVSDTDTVDLTLTGLDITADAIISPDAGNQLVANVNGLFVPTTIQKFTFNRLAAVTHTITHNLGNQFPAVTIYDPATSEQVIPYAVTGLDPNTLFVAMFTSVAIAGTIIG